MELRITEHRLILLVGVRATNLSCCEYRRYSKICGLQLYQYRQSKYKQQRAVLTGTIVSIFCVVNFHSLPYLVVLLLLHFLCTRIKSFSLEIRRPRPLDINQSISTISRKKWLARYVPHFLLLCFSMVQQKTATRKLPTRMSLGVLYLGAYRPFRFCFVFGGLQPPVTSTDACVCVSSLSSRVPINALKIPC
jgi:hypothetical protein